MSEPWRANRTARSALSAARPGRYGAPTDLVERVRRRLAASGTAATPAAVASLLREETAGLLGDAELLALLRVAQAEICGAGPLDPLLADPDTTDILVNGPAEVWIDGASGLRRAGVRFPDEASVRRLAQRLAATAGRRLDDARPWVDATLPDGTRLHAVLPPVAPSGTCLSLRLSRHRPFTLTRLVELGTLTRDSARLVDGIVRARLAFLIAGGTGSGKTTLLSTLLGRVDPAERMVLVEDAGELRPDHEHVVRLAARPPNVEGAGEVTLRDLVRQALRMRPDRLIVGEVRGSEVVELLNALNTGHEGGAGTVHANSPAELPARLEALGALGGLDRPALHSQLAAAVSVVLHLRRGPGGNRVLSEIALLRRIDGLVVPVPAWRWGAGPPDPALVELLAARGVRVPCRDGTARSGMPPAGPGGDPHPLVPGVPATSLVPLLPLVRDGSP
ncbi:MAG TPA: TadA family conjugal transfer-associated ATPase [Mycobacteriales bacterium]|nr:TadA family conjugal transfer-associated ATPase [Mycobacteriales bacterium]